MSENVLKYAAFKSQVEPTFWQKLAEIKLEVDKRNEIVRRLWGYYSNKKPEGLNHLFTLDASSFNNVPEPYRLFSAGSIYNKNSVEGFKTINKAELIKLEGMTMMKIIKEEAIEEPYLLARFILISYGDLKNHQFFYWFAFPAPTFIYCKNSENPRSIKDMLSDDQLDDLCVKYFALEMKERGFFYGKTIKNSVELYNLKKGIKKVNEGGEFFIGFSDCSDTKFPSWPLRNYIAFVTYHNPELVNKPLKIICVRLTLTDGKWKANKSLFLTVQVVVDNAVWSQRFGAGEQWVGWERNDKGNMGPRLTSLKNFMSPQVLAENSVDLNLKLMKWQILPDLNLEAIKRTKCLLIGAGTLGCACARNLIAWGVRCINFIDLATVSYSNPVRQVLYKFKDVGSSKAETAALALKEVFPAVVSTGFNFSIPMPGHAICDSLMDETKINVKVLEDLIDDHDAIFLLLDSREGRWLPTVIAASKQKLVINVALGFDSYLVLRHGIKLPSGSVSKELNPYKNCLTGDRLGCYFCHDDTAPGNSSKGRTLDQQCTVTRPGVANIAAGSAVELFIALIQHPLCGLAPADTACQVSNPDSILGLIPHSIRGFISDFTNLTPALEAFSSCVACSDRVLKKYHEDGIDFIVNSIQSREYLEEVCGLNSIKEDAVINDVIEYTDSDPEGEG